MIVVDIETTGTSPERHAILSIGAVNFKNIQNQFYEECRVSSYNLIDNKALHINGFKRKNILSKEKQSLKSSLLKFSKWIEEQNVENFMIGHNIHFDYEFLKKAYKKNRIIFPFTYRLIDIHSIAFYESLNFEKERTPHNALIGAKLETKVLYKLIYNKDIFTDL